MAASGRDLTDQPEWVTSSNRLLRSHPRNLATESHFPDAAAMSAEGAGAEWRQINHVELNRLQRRSQVGIKSFFPT